MRLMVMQHYLDEELFITKDGVAVAYLRTGSKTQDLLSGKINNVRYENLPCVMLHFVAVA